jgi:hypothetical protein
MRRWREAIEEAAGTGPATGRVRPSLCIAAAIPRDAHGTVLDRALEADTEGDPIFAGWLYGTCIVLDAMHRPGAAWQARAEAVAAELRSSPPADVRDLAATVDAHLLLLQNRFDQAGDAFEAATRPGGKTWAAETPVYMVGDCGGRLPSVRGTTAGGPPCVRSGRRRRPRRERTGQHGLPG